MFVNVGVATGCCMNKSKVRVMKESGKSMRTMYLKTNWPLRIIQYLVILLYLELAVNISEIINLAAAS